MDSPDIQPIDPGPKCEVRLTDPGPDFGDLEELLIQSEWLAFAAIAESNKRGGIGATEEYLDVRWLELQNREDLHDTLSGSATPKITY